MAFVSSESRKAIVTGIVISLIVNLCPVLLGQGGKRYEFNNQFYRFPTQYSDAGLYNNGQGQLSWSSEIPPGMMMFSIGICPPGWTEWLTMRGYYPVGNPLTGQSPSFVGNSLSNNENRIIGLHSHVVAAAVALSGSHTHTVNDPGHVHSGNIGVASSAFGDPLNSIGTDPGSQALFNVGITTASLTGLLVPPVLTNVAIASQSLTVDPVGSLSTTLAPALYMIPCLKV
jgi:hypothetical protein